MQAFYTYTYELSQVGPDRTSYMFRYSIIPLFRKSSQTKKSARGSFPEFKRYYWTRLRSQYRTRHASRICSRRRVHKVCPTHMQCDLPLTYTPRITLAEIMATLCRAKLFKRILYHNDNEDSLAKFNRQLDDAFKWFLVKYLCHLCTIHADVRCCLS